MGLFIYVNEFEAPLLCCGNICDEWQSKDMSIKGHRIQNRCQSISLDSDMEGEIHAWCIDCEKMTEYWIEAKAIKVRFR